MTTEGVKSKFSFLHSFQKEYWQKEIGNRRYGVIEETERFIHLFVSFTVPNLIIL